MPKGKLLFKMRIVSQALEGFKALYFCPVHHPASNLNFVRWRKYINICSSLLTLASILKYSCWMKLFLHYSGIDIMNILCAVKLGLFLLWEQPYAVLICNSIPLHASDLHIFFHSWACSKHPNPQKEEAVSKIVHLACIAVFLLSAILKNGHWK